MSDQSPHAIETNVPAQASDEAMPCPCCGESALLQEQEPHRHSQCIAAFIPDHPGSFTVECSACACAMIANTRAEVLAMWNRRATPRATAGVERDAARWRAFVGSARIKMQGSAGLTGETNPYGKPWNGYAHLGMEIWTTFGRDYSQKLLDQMDADNALGREWLTKYADIAIEAQRATKGAKP